MEDNKFGAPKPPRAGGAGAGGLVVRQDGRRPLFGATKANTAQPADTKIPTLARSKSSPGGPSIERMAPAPASPAVSASPGGSRIPRFGSAGGGGSGAGGFGRRKPMTLSEAYQLAGEEEDVSSSRPGPIDGSPSPAPRSWRMRPGGPDDARMRNMLNQDHLDTKTGGAAPAAAVSPNKERIALRNRVDDGINKSRTSRWVLEEGLRDSSMADANTAADVPLPSTENVPPGLEAAASPEKSYAWQVEDDFTAGDLQVSDSPRIRVNTHTGKSPFANRRSLSPKKGTTPNTKLDEIKARELGLAPNVAGSPLRRTKIDEIRSREKEAEREIPLLDRAFPRIGGGGHTKLDDIRKLETQGLSKRAIAAAKLEEIKERNAMTRSVSPDAPRRSWPDYERAAGIPRSRSAFEPTGRQVPDTPVMIYKNRAEMIADDVRRAAAKKLEDSKKETEAVAKAEADNYKPTGGRRDANGLSPDKRAQSHDLLRRLARATSASPAPSDRQREDMPQKPSDGKTTAVAAIKSSAAHPRASSLKRSSLVDTTRRRTSNTSSNASKNTSSSGDRPTVGFAGLSARSRSSDSRKSKRSSMHSEQDPTDRIEAEERLFAPRDDYSERGSVRAGSPMPDPDDEGDDDDEYRMDNDATPKPARQDPHAMPTPRAPGAYVETPVTIKKEARDTGVDLDVRPSSRRRRASLESTSEDVKPQPAATVFGAKKPHLAWRDKDLDTASDPGAPSDGDKEAKTARTRTRSLPRKRPLKNSAKLPSVRDDLRELQRIHNIDDSTLDNLEEILLGKKTTSEKLDVLLKEIPAAAEIAAEIKAESPPAVVSSSSGRSSLDTGGLDDELAAYEKLSASVERDILGLTKSQKPKSEKTPSSTTASKQKQQQHAHKHATDASCPICVAEPATHTVAYLHLPLPRLFYRTPTLRFTFLGLLLCALSLWYAAESALCAMYCRPVTCSGPEPCVWSFDDPSAFGTALPVKLDQWMTGGYGRVAYDMFAEDVGDWAADVLDSLRGTRLEEADVEGMTTEQRRRYRRRMAKKSGARKKNTSMSAEQRAKVDAWRKERLARDRARDGGYVREESVGGDQRVWP